MEVPILGGKSVNKRSGDVSGSCWSGGTLEWWRRLSKEVETPGRHQTDHVVCEGLLFLRLQSRRR